MRINFFLQNQPKLFSDGREIIDYGRNFFGMDTEHFMALQAVHGAVHALLQREHQVEIVLQAVAPHRDRARFVLFSCCGFPHGGLDTVQVYAVALRGAS